jgi:pimeloyl-ACP methyl ester carboxylesterase
MAEVSHRFVDTNGIRVHVAEAGQGPPVVLLHGFPECWYSWRHQLSALAGAGFHAVAPDQRGYCRTDRPEAIDRYTLLHLVGDVVGLLDALGAERAVVVGHDWGAPVAWHTALLRPDRVRGVAALSVPFRPPGARRPLETLRATAGDGFYQLYFQEPGVADAELARDARTTFRRLLHSGSGAGSGQMPIVPPGGGLLDVMPEPEALPGWLTEADLDVYVAEFEPSGFTGGLNWYRNIDRNAELLAAWRGARVLPPALYMAGDRDLVISFPGAERQIASLRASVPNLWRTVVLPGVGHWTQQEEPDRVNANLIEFLRALEADEPDRR